MAELPTQRDFEDFSAWTGRDVLAPGGERLGAVELIFLDEATDRPEWVLVRLEDAGEAAIVPLAGATVEERSIRVEHAADRVAAAPRLDVGETLSVADERRLYEHYGLAYSEHESSTVLPEGAGGDADAQPTEARPRLRKYTGAPVPPAAQSGEPEDEPAREASAAVGADMPETKGTGTSESTSAASAPPTPIPPPAPRPIPPEGGFQAQEGGDDADAGGPMALLKRRPALPLALAGGIAALIAVLALRRRR